MNKKIIKKEGSLAIRVFMVYLFVVLASVGVLYRIIDLQISHKHDLRTRLEAERKTIKPVDIPVERGVILSRNNEILVERLPIYKIHMDTYPKERIKGENGNPDVTEILLPDSIFNAHVAALGDSLTALFGVANPSWEQKLRTAREKQLRYFKISETASRKDYIRLQTFPIFYDNDKKKYNPYNALCKAEPNLDHVMHPFGDLAGRTLGYTRKNNDTLQNQNVPEREPVGIEGYFDEELAGTPGLILRKYIGTIPTDIESKDNIYPRNGYDITTTLDMTIQYIANEELLSALRKDNAEKGCVVVMDVATGDVLAMVNLSRDKSGNYRETENNALAMYEPGSTFKTASLMVALEDGKVTPNTEIPINYIYGKTAQVGYRKVTDDDELKINNPELWHIFAHSSNVGTSRAIYNNYASLQQQFIDGLYKLGFGDTLRFSVIGGDRKPLLRNTFDRWWSKMSLSTIPYGYEVEVTPLHLLAFYNAIANNGCMVQPRLVTKISSKDSTVRIFDVDTLNARICSERTLRDISGMLDSAITCGTGRKGFATAPYSVAGKTGTAEDLSAGNKGKNLYNASFCGYFPVDNPKYSCIVVVKGLEKKGNRYYGGVVALPIFRNIADKIYATDYDLIPEAKSMSQNTASIPISAKARSKTLETIFNGINFNIPVPQKSEWIKIQGDRQQLNIKATAFSENVIPDVTGMSLTDAVYILDKAGIKPEVKGYGRVKKQYPEANAPLKKDRKVILELNIES